MPILKHHHSENFTVISNSILRDKRLSFKARGLGAYLYSLPDGWEFSISGIIADGGKDKRDAIESAAHELELAGYLYREKKRNNGQFSGGTWILSDDPIFTVGENPERENPQQINKETIKPQNGQFPVTHGIDVFMDDDEQEALNAKRRRAHK